MKYSIVMPVYKVEEYIEKSITSVLNQTYTNFELIILNDGSPDNSEKIIKKYTKDKRIKYIKKDNTGVSDTRNKGVELASGDYLFFLDSDDYIDSDFLEKVNKNIKNLDLLKIGFKRVDINEKVIDISPTPIFSNQKGIDAFYTLVDNGVMIDQPSLFIYNLKYYKKNNFHFRVGTFHEDFGLLPEILIKANKVSSTDITFNYLVRPNSTMTNKNMSFVIKKAYDVLTHYDYLKEIINSIKTDKKNKDAFIYYIENTTIAKLYTLKSDLNEYKKYKRELKKRGIYKYTCKSNYKYIIKKTILKLSTSFYLKRILKVDKWFYS